MQNTKVIIYEWAPDRLQPGHYLDIDWPVVHRECGLDHIEWIEKQDKSKCQMSLEFHKGQRRLIVEFFDKDIEMTYHLMWAK
jgi:hypothetical protein